jgi:hypothetical protein
VALVEHFRSQVNTALLDYCSLLSLTVNDDDTVVDKFGRMLLELSDIKMASLVIENYLYQQYLNGNTEESNLLVEMLLSSRQ